MKFWDASAILPLLVHEPHTSQIRALYEEDPAVIIWWGTPIEVASAIARSERENRISSEERLEIISKAQEFLPTCSVIEPVNAISERAQRLVHNHPLKAADALQLASLLVAVREEPRRLPFLSVDKRLREAAAKEGFSVLPR